MPRLAGRGRRPPSRRRRRCSSLVNLVVFLEPERVSRRRARGDHHERGDERGVGEVRAESTGARAADARTQEEDESADLNAPPSKGHIGGGSLGKRPVTGWTHQLRAAAHAQEEHAETHAGKVVGGARRDEGGAEDDEDEARAYGDAGAERVARETHEEAPTLYAPRAAREHRAELALP